MFGLPFWGFNSKNKRTHQTGKKSIFLSQLLRKRSSNHLISFFLFSRMSSVFKTVSLSNSEKSSDIHVHHHELQLYRPQYLHRVNNNISRYMT